MITSTAISQCVEVFTGFNVHGFIIIMIKVNVSLDWITIFIKVCVSILGMFIFNWFIGL